ncbi:MAG: hypothetical protein JXB88_00640 [Spirochaetales bacterium]|nr:hypothetical protein [Spirochaetales bacterium]
MGSDINAAIKKAEAGIAEYLEESREKGKIDDQLYRIASRNILPNLKEWLNDNKIDEISPRLKGALIAEIEKGNWLGIVNAYRQNIRFGTGGIRGMMAFDKKSIELLAKEGLDAPILKGPNTINNIVLLKTSVGVAQFGKEKNYNKIVIGYDSRIRGQDLAKLVAELFLAYGYIVYFFDEVCPYPEVTYAIPDSNIKAHIGILISASHNDYRYNGYKLSCSNGSQFDPRERDEMFEHYIAPAKTDDIKLCSFEEAVDDKLYFLGGAEQNSRFDYAGKEKNLINIHERHRNHVKSFLMIKDLKEMQERSRNHLKIGYCAFHGAGTYVVPRLLSEVGYRTIWQIKRNKLNECNGLFPSFRSLPGLEQQPDPGDPRAGRIAVDAFRLDYPDNYDDMDILIGTDPDADRCGVLVPVPKNQQFLYDDQEWTLLPADELWALVIWYRLMMEKELYGVIRDQEKKFITLSHTTSDCITRVALKHNIGVAKTWVGFAALSAVTRDIWNGKYKEYLTLKDGRNEKYTDFCHEFTQECYGFENGLRALNIGAMEQSNGFSILGGPPPDRNSLGQDGHVRDKDGTFAAFLTAEIAAWAKEKGTTLFNLIDDEIYLDPEIGLFVNFYEPDPLDGEYPGIEGDRIKKAILRRTLGYFQLALSGDLTIAGLPVKRAAIYRTGKYDAIYPPTYDFQFPDEGVRLFFDDAGLNHITIRPSGTGNALRLHTQLHEDVLDEHNKVISREKLIALKYKLRFLSKEILTDVREKLKAPRGKLFL